MKLSTSLHWIMKSNCPLKNKRLKISFNVCINSIENTFVDIFDLNDYSKVFSENRKNLCNITELRCGNFVMSYEKGKIEVANIDLEAKSLNVVKVLEDHDSDVNEVKELSN